MLFTKPLTAFLSLKIFSSGNKFVSLEELLSRLEKFKANYIRST